MRQENIVIAQPVKKDMMSQTEDLEERTYVLQNESVAELLEETVNECPGEIEEDQGESKLTKKKRRWPPKPGTSRKKIVKLIERARRGRGRPPKKKRTIDILRKIDEGTSVKVPEKRLQPARSCKKN